jgi:hypothetical protein
VAVHLDDAILCLTKVNGTNPAGASMRCAVVGEEALAAGDLVAQLGGVPARTVGLERQGGFRQSEGCRYA